MKRYFHKFSWTCIFINFFCTAARRQCSRWNVVLWWKVAYCTSTKPHRSAQRTGNGGEQRGRRLLVQPTFCRPSRHLVLEPTFLLSTHRCAYPPDVLVAASFPGCQFVRCKFTKYIIYIIYTWLIALPAFWHSNAASFCALCLPLVSPAQKRRCETVADTFAGRSSKTDDVINLFRSRGGVAGRWTLPTSFTRRSGPDCGTFANAQLAQAFDIVDQWTSQTDPACAHCSAACVAQVSLFFFLHICSNLQALFFVAGIFQFSAICNFWR